MSHVYALPETHPSCKRWGRELGKRSEGKGVREKEGRKRRDGKGVKERE
jgi:hypothetical protein